MNPKTDLPCDCGTITMMMSEPDSPISICPHNGLFLLNGCHVVYFCFSCGGKLPDTSKPIYVPFLSPEERARLEELAQGINTREEAIARLGTPDYDDKVAYCAEDVNSGALSEEGEVLDSSIPRTHNVEFYGLSKTGNIEFYFSPAGRAHFVIMPKWAPPRHLEEGETP